MDINCVPVPHRLHFIVCRYGMSGSVQFKDAVDASGVVITPTDAFLIRDRWTHADYQPPLEFHLNANYDDHVELTSGSENEMFLMDLFHWCAIRIPLQMFPDAWSSLVVCKLAQQKAKPSQSFHKGRDDNGPACVRAFINTFSSKRDWKAIAMCMQLWRNVQSDHLEVKLA